MWPTSMVAVVVSFLPLLVVTPLERPWLLRHTAAAASFSPSIPKHGDLFSRS